MSKKQRSEAEQDWLDDHDDDGRFYAGEQADAMKHHLAETYSAQGEREGEMTSEGNLSLAPLALPDELRKSQHGKVGAFADAFNVYCIPMDRTLKAVGRVQDLVSSGAPQVPHELDGAQRKAFHLLDDHKDQEAKEDYKEWRDARKRSASSLHEALGVQSALHDAHKRWNKARLILERRAKEKMLHAAEDKRDRLQAVIDLATGVVDVVRKTAEVATGVAEADGAWAATKAASGGLPDEFSLEAIVGDVVFRMGDGVAIQNTIDHLEREIVALGIDSEGLEIAAAGDAVKAIGEQELAASLRLRDDTRSMREGAKLFADQAGASNDMPMATLVAEAYQELRLFGDEAHAQAKHLKPYLKAVGKALSENEAQIRSDAARGRDPDIDAPRVNSAPSELFIAFTSVRRYNLLMGEQLPDWRHKEELWTAFFEANYGNDKKGRKEALKKE